MRISSTLENGAIINLTATACGLTPKASSTKATPAKENESARPETSATNGSTKEFILMTNEKDMQNSSSWMENSTMGSTWMGILRELENGSF